METDKIYNKDKIITKEVELLEIGETQFYLLVFQLLLILGGLCLF